MFTPIFKAFGLQVYCMSTSTGLCTCILAMRSIAIMLCRDHIHFLREKGLWQDDNQNAGALSANATAPQADLSLWITTYDHFSVALTCMSRTLSKLLTHICKVQLEYVQTVCCLQMQEAYDEYNDHARSSGKSRGHFIVDLCRPGHLTLCLRNFQERIKCNDDNWDAQFGVPLYKDR